ncbi:MAG TPA: 3-dehydroquinate synthase, partial [Planctomycetota bacterium]|nr:3-dehydroquinate synthase [Planctomycetota bacterium]
DRLKEGRRHRVLVYVDSGVAGTHPDLIARIKTYFHDRPDALELTSSPDLIPGGEEAKRSWDLVKDILWTIGNHHLDRHSFIVGIGGGSVLDMVGFATSLVHRGLRMVRVPTTVLAQNDAGVGVKNGMDEHGAKNYVGTFAPPFAVINDYGFLPTLADRDWIGGIAEAFKVALIKDAPFFEFLCANATKLRARDQDAMETLVRRTAVLHLEHIRDSGDPFEMGEARPLDFGHWAGHKLEAMSDYAVGHGQAIAVGIALDAYYAMRQELISSAELERILSAMTACGLPIYHRLLEERTRDGVLVILDGLEQFREHLGGTLNVTLPRGIGAKVEVHQVYADVVEDAIAHLRERHVL